MFKFSKNSLLNREGVDQRLIDISNLAIQITNVDFGIPKLGGLRTADNQAALFASNKSKADGVVNKSYHQSGKALDVYAYVDGKASWSKQDLAIVACAMLQAAAELGYKLKWGGLWKSWQDFPHFELQD
jgi:peptidoglycan L-alanyl-D-glutamate endopeptidase CwlK|tara:strand:- start:455 stop:841 length:387 start_codon:yes stop_codon:yes gene_type:complete